MANKTNSSRAMRALKREVKTRMSKTPDNKKTGRRSTIFMRDQHITVEIIPSSQVPSSQFPSSQLIDCDQHNGSVLLGNDIELDEVICALCKRGEDDIIIRKCDYCHCNKCIQCEGMVEAIEGEETETEKENKLEQIRKMVEYKKSNKREHYQCKQCEENNENIDAYKLKIEALENYANMLERRLKNTTNKHEKMMKAGTREMQKKTEK